MNFIKVTEINLISQGATGKDLPALHTDWTWYGTTPVARYRKEIGGLSYLNADYIAEVSTSDYEGVGKVVEIIDHEGQFTTVAESLEEVMMQIERARA